MRIKKGTKGDYKNRVLELGGLETVHPVEESWALIIGALVPGEDDAVLGVIGFWSVAGEKNGEQRPK